MNLFLVAPQRVVSAAVDVVPENGLIGRARRRGTLLAAPVIYAFASLSASALFMLSTGGLRALVEDPSAPTTCTRDRRRHWKTSRPVEIARTSVLPRSFHDAGRRRSWVRVVGEALDGGAARPAPAAAASLCNFARAVVRASRERACCSNPGRVHRPQARQLRVALVHPRAARFPASDLTTQCPCAGSLVTCRIDESIQLGASNCRCLPALVAADASTPRAGGPQTT